MFVQIHMLQSMPPGNLNRDKEGQPKKCLFGGVTRGRISSQCLKRRIRHSDQFKEVFGDALACRTTFLPSMVADALRNAADDLDKAEIREVSEALSKRFKKEKEKEQVEDSELAADGAGAAPNTAGNADSDGAFQTGQLVFFPPPFANAIADRILTFKTANSDAYAAFLGRKPKAKADKEQKEQWENQIKEMIGHISKDSQTLSVDIGLFGRMTTSDLLMDVEAACQVAHAMSTHEVIIESDWFTAMDDLDQGPGAAYIGSGKQQTFFDSATYYKYLNVDLDALGERLGKQGRDLCPLVAATLLRAAALATPTGKQNSFASHSVPQLILVEVSKTRRPLSYANAFLEPVEGPDYLAQSATALKSHVEEVSAAFAPKDMRRFLLAVGPCNTDIAGAETAESLDALAETLQRALAGISGAVHA